MRIEYGSRAMYESSGPLLPPPEVPLSAAPGPPDPDGWNDTSTTVSMMNAGRKLRWVIGSDGRTQQVDTTVSPW